MSQLRLDTAIQYVPGVGPAHARQLESLGVATLEDLLTYYPRRFDLRRQCQPIATLRGDEPAATVAGQVQDVSEKNFGRLPSFSCTIADDTGFVLVKWFHGGYLRDKIKPGMLIAVDGKVGVWKEYLEFINPRFQIVYDPDQTNLNEDELVPVYPAGAHLSSGMIAHVIRKVLPESLGLVREWFDEPYLAQRGLMKRPAAVAAMHRPEDKDHWGAARRRLAYDECLLMQLGIALTRMREVSRPAHPIKVSPEIDRRIRARFPFAMTPAQDKVVAEIAHDIARERPMNRLLQGDVGSGKTVVALYAVLAAVAGRRQAAIMAPTEILAMQHYRKIEQYLAGSKVRLGLLVGGQSAAAARGDAGAAGCRRDQHRRRHARVDFGWGEVLATGAGGGGRAAQVRRRAADEHSRQGVRAALPGDDRHADPAHAGHDALRRPGYFDDRRAAAGARQDDDQGRRPGTHA